MFRNAESPVSDIFDGAGVHPLRDLFDAAVRHKSVKLTCTRCGHAKIFSALALWWLFERKHAGLGFARWLTIACEKIFSSGVPGLRGNLETDALPCPSPHIALYARPSGGRFARGSLNGLVLRGTAKAGLRRAFSAFRVAPRPRDAAFGIRPFAANHSGPARALRKSPRCGPVRF